MNNLELGILLINCLLFYVFGMRYCNIIASYGIYFKEYSLLNKINTISFVIISLGMGYHFVRLTIALFSNIVKA